MLHREVLSAEWFTTIERAEIVNNHCLRQYTHTRPHQALNIRPPVPETILENPQISGPDTDGQTVSIGGVVPLLLKRFGQGPAAASGPRLTTIIGMAGSFLVLRLASLMMSLLV